MTDREALIILAAGFANQEYTAAGAVEEAVAALKLIDEHLAAQAVPEPATGETDPLTQYPWAKMNRHGDIVDTRAGTYPIIKAPNPNVWHAYATPDCQEKVTCDSFADACRIVNWPEWDWVNAR